MDRQQDLTKTLVTTESSSPSVEEGRFVPGSVIGERYRVVELLGHGGMGEVYKANDLKLGQPVALKFLPDSISRSPSALQKFRAEVRMARQVSHPSVCRVYDLAEVDGHTFLSMEYVNGEDLGALLKRIGRLPQDKALEIARSICAGLAAAHDRGILHRDLKPSNVLVNSEGRALIADFGLAALASEVGGSTGGTPAYMAPELFRNKPSTVESDIFSLGLLLYELFTGRRASRSLDKDTQSQLNWDGREIDPAVERAVLQCVETDPELRPSSALAVAAALPGGDPLRAALAAGETPSPRLVAAAGETLGISAAGALIVLLLLVAAMGLSLVLASRTNYAVSANLIKPPDVLRDRAQQILSAAGVPEGYDRASGWTLTGEHQKERKGPQLVFWYRQSPGALVNTDLDTRGGTIGSITPEEPPSLRPGMADVELDAAGRLLQLRVVPAPRASNSQPVSWDKLLAASGFDLSRLTPSKPQWLPEVMAQQTAAWEISDRSFTPAPFRMEAAGAAGNPVWFRLAYPWTNEQSQNKPPLTSLQRQMHMVRVLLFTLLAALTIVLARSNLKAGRGDMKGAYRLSTAIFGTHIVALLLGAHHTATKEQISVLALGIAFGLLKAASIYLGYLALEPLARRRWPQALISWTRLLAGRWNDPLAGRDILIGLTAGAFCAVIHFAGDLALSASTGSTAHHIKLQYLNGSRAFASAIIDGLFPACSAAFALVLLYFLLRLGVKSAVWTVTLSALTYAAISTAGSWAAPFELPPAIAIALVVFAVAARFGLTAVVFLQISMDMLVKLPITFDPDLWYASYGWVIYGMLLTLGFAAYRIALARRRVLPALP